MIQMIKTYDECRDYVLSFDQDPSFSDPMLSNEEELQNNLRKAVENPGKHSVLGVYQDGRMTGLFSFLILREEQYIEMLVGLSRVRDAYREVIYYLEKTYPGCNADFVFCPGNYLLMEQLKSKGAQFEIEQQKMVHAGSVPELDLAGVELYSEKYAGQYFAIHDKEGYWTGEKVAAAQERFRIFLAVHEGKVVGYLDVTCCFEENEPYDLFVLEACRRKGYGRKLLAKALEMNRPKGMMLLVDVDNAPAIHLYESLGFGKIENGNSITAHWAIPVCFPD